MADDNDDADWAVESDYRERVDDQPGPPDNWGPPNWFCSKKREWWWRNDRGQWHLDPCPAKARGMRNGEYFFATPFGEVRSSSSRDLHNYNGLSDLFVGKMWWPLRHYRKYDHEEKKLKGGVLVRACADALIQACEAFGYYDDSKPLRGFGTWRGGDGRPVVHAGNRIFDGDDIVPPGTEIDDTLYVVSVTRKPPACELEGRDRFHWLPAPANHGRIVAGHLDEWVWDSPEARDLFLGGLHCDMLCSALRWLPHKFVLAPHGSGKSSLLRYARTLLGGGAHQVVKDYTKAYHEQGFGGTASAFYLDEFEKGNDDADRMRKIIEFVRLLSDDGAVGGRGSSGGKARQMDVHGTITMAATVTSDWPPQDRSRITLLELKPFADRQAGHPPATSKQLEGQLDQAAEMSAPLRARAMAKWDLFLQNLEIAGAATLELGGTPRDAEQLGHLIAGWKTMTSDELLSEVDELARFRPFIMTVTESEDAEDAGSELLNTIFTLTPDLWRTGDRMTVGQLISIARKDDDAAAAARKQLKMIGMRLEKMPGESWSNAWLWVATNHAGLNKLPTGYAKYQGKGRSQILIQLRCCDQHGVEHRVKKGGPPVRFSGGNSRYVMVPPLFLPGADDD